MVNFYFLLFNIKIDMFFFSKSNYNNLNIIWDFNNNSFIIKGNLGVLVLKNFLNRKKFLKLKNLSENKEIFWIDNKFYKMLKSNIINICKGVSFGWFVRLELIGRNYNIYCYEKDMESFLIVMDLGYSHNILLNIPKKIKFFFKKNYIFLYSLDLIFLKNFSKLICNLKPLDIYKGKGIKFYNEKIILKLGKQSQYK